MHATAGPVVLARVPGMTWKTQHSAPLDSSTWLRPSLAGRARGVCGGGGQPGRSPTDREGVRGKAGKQLWRATGKCLAPFLSKTGNSFREVPLPNGYRLRCNCPFHWSKGGRGVPNRQFPNQCKEHPNEKAKFCYWEKLLEKFVLVG